LGLGLGRALLAAGLLQALAVGNLLLPPFIFLLHLVVYGAFGQLGLHSLGGHRLSARVLLRELQQLRRHGLPSSLKELRERPSQRGVALEHKGMRDA
jgi:hypothetical protein